MENNEKEIAEVTQEENKTKKENSVWKDVLDFVKTMAISMIVVFLVAQFIFRPIRVRGSSMYPTLEDGSLGISNVIGRNIDGIERFDIVIIKLANEDEFLVKRVIGLPGETVSYKDGQLYINGEAIEEDFLDEDYMEDWGKYFMGDVEEYTLGENEYYCLGDNRPASKDSRYYGAFYDYELIAKGVLIFYPFNLFGAHTW